MKISNTKQLKSNAHPRRGQGLIEYIVIIAAVALISLVAVWL